jgi:hypothetical protein
MQHFLQQYDAIHKQAKELQFAIVSGSCASLQPYACEVSSYFAYRPRNDTANADQSHSAAASIAKDHPNHHQQQHHQQFQRQWSKLQALQNRVAQFASTSAMLHGILKTTATNETNNNDIINNNNNNNSNNNNNYTIQQSMNAINVAEFESQFKPAYQQQELAALAAFREHIHQLMSRKEESVRTLCEQALSALQTMNQACSMYAQLWKQKEHELQQSFLCQIQFLDAWKALFLDQVVRQAVQFNLSTVKQYQELLHTAQAALTQVGQSESKQLHDLYRGATEQFAKKRVQMLSLLEALQRCSATLPLGKRSLLINNTNINNNNNNNNNNKSHNESKNTDRQSVRDELNALHTQVGQLSCQHILIAISPQTPLPNISSAAYPSSQPVLPLMTNDLIRVLKALQACVQTIAIQCSNSTSKEGLVSEKTAQHQHRATKPNSLDAFAICKDYSLYQSQKMQDKHQQLNAFYQACLQEIANKEKIKQDWYRQHSSQPLRRDANNQHQHQHNTQLDDEYPGHNAYTLEYMLQLQPELDLLKENSVRLAEKLQIQLSPKLANHKEALECFERSQQLMEEMESTIAWSLKQVAQELSILGEKRKRKRAALEQLLLQQHLMDQTISSFSQQLQQSQELLLRFTFYSIEQCYALMVQHLQTVWQHKRPEIDRLMQGIDQIHNDIAGNRANPALAEVLANGVLKARTAVIQHITAMEQYHQKLLAYFLFQRTVHLMQVMESTLAWTSCESSVAALPLSLNDNSLNHISNNNNNHNLTQLLQLYDDNCRWALERMLYK